jgi:RimJ/RimL family protein N-acetyltransferase
MPIEYYTDAVSFAQETQPFLLQHEAENCITIGLIGGLAANAFSPSTLPLLALARAEGRVIGVVLQIPPRNLILTVMEAGTTEQFARDLFADGIQVPGIMGPLQTAEAFAAAWCAVSGMRAEISMRERVFALDKVIPPRPPGGHFRWATPEDRETIIAWGMAEEREALHVAEPNRADFEGWADRMVQRSERRGLGFWEDGGQAVSFSAYGNPTPHGIRIAPVYTPPELRGRGYASACVAALSQSLLDSGRQQCYLYTDLANPTSNKIYQAIGYHPVGDALEMQFLRP